MSASLAPSYPVRSSLKPGRSSRWKQDETHRNMRSDNSNPKPEKPIHFPKQPLSHSNPRLPHNPQSFRSSKRESPTPLRQYFPEMLKTKAPVLRAETAAIPVAQAMLSAPPRREAKAGKEKTPTKERSSNSLVSLQHHISYSYLYYRIIFLNCIIKKGNRLKKEKTHATILAI